MQYVLGFQFTPDKRMVVLIQKARPFWMAGKWNGIGGMIEYGETLDGAMCREFEEETGVDQGDVTWRYTGLIYVPNKDPINPAIDELHLFRSFTPSALKVKTEVHRGEHAMLFHLPLLKSFHCDLVENVFPFIEISLNLGA